MLSNKELDQIFTPKFCSPNWSPYYKEVALQKKVQILLSNKEEDNFSPKNFWLNLEKLS